MPYKGVIKNKVVVLEDGASLPEGTKVTIVPEEDNDVQKKELQEKWRKFNEGTEKVYQRLLSEVGITSDSVEILRQLREERAKR